MGAVRFALRLVALSALGTTSMRCAGASPARPVPSPVASVAPAVEPLAVAPMDLAPVAAPADIFVIARWKNPHASLSTIAGLSGASPQLLESSANALADQALSHAFRGDVDGHAIAGTLSLDASVDMIVSLDTGHRAQPHPLYAFSFGLTSFERAKGVLEASRPLEEVAPGLYRVGTKNSGDLTCAIGPASGGAQARLVCGAHDRDVVTLGPYMLRTLPLEPPPATDLHAEVLFRPVEARYGAELRLALNFLPDFAASQAIGEPTFHRALEETAKGLGAEIGALSTDLDRLSIDVKLDPSAGAVAARGSSCSECAPGWRIPWFRSGRRRDLPGALLARAHR